MNDVPPGTNTNSIPALFVYVGGRTVARGFNAAGSGGRAEADTGRTTAAGGAVVAGGSAGTAGPVEVEEWFPPGQPAATAAITAPVVTTAAESSRRRQPDRFGPVARVRTSGGPVDPCSSTSITSSADPYRSSGFRAMSLATTAATHGGTSGRTSRTGRGTPWTTLISAAVVFAASTGGRPVSMA